MCIRKQETVLTRAEQLSRDKEIFFTSTITRIIHETALLCPEKTAVADEKQFLTYKMLDTWSSLLADYLIRDGVRQEEVVCVYTGRNVYAVLCMLAIWKAGATYLYMDDTYPTSRQDWILRCCEVERVLPLHKVRQLLQEFEDRAGTDTQSVDRSRPEDLAVIIFTSGTTSRPKGVMLEHKNIAASISNFDRQLLRTRDVVSVFAGFGFVASIFDILSPLVCGATLDIIPEETRRKIDAIVDYWNERHITISFLPPHMAMKLMDMDDDRIPLHVLLVGSEPTRNLKKKPYHILNLYASSEMCAQVTVYEIQDEQKQYPIGKVGPNLRYYIVDEEGRPVPRGTVGELWLAGPQVSRGYWKMPEETAEAYISNPFTDDPKYARLFRTKDRVKELPDGNLFYIGRLGNMYKIRGFRVEGGEVENALLSCEKVREVVVKAFEDQGGTNILCAFCTSNEPLDPKEIKRKLREFLPGYMIPSAIIQLPSFPRLPNGKADRRALEAPAQINDHKLLEKLY